MLNSSFLGQTLGPPNPRVHTIGDRNAPALQQSHSSRGTGSASGREWNARPQHGGSASHPQASIAPPQTTPYLTVATHHERRGSHGHPPTASDGQRLYPVTSHQPLHIRPGNTAPLHNVQGQHRYVEGPGNYRYLPRVFHPTTYWN
jgi:hypothetical protein